MFSLPEWAPSVHPLVVHFPIAILFVAALADFGALVLRRYGWLQAAAVGLFVLGALAAVVALLTGRDAAGNVLLPAAANPLLTEHADWAGWTVWFYGVFAAIRLSVERWDRRRRLAVHLPLFAVGALGLLLVAETGEYGAQMVYQHGVGVAMGEGAGGARAAHADTTDAEQGVHGRPGAGLQLVENGGWHWDVGRGDGQILQDRFEWMQGFRSEMNPAVLHDAMEGDVLALRPEGNRALFVTGAPMRSLQFDLRMNLDGFDGKVMLVHHVQSHRSYNFLELEGRKVRLGRVADGEAEIEDEGSTDAAGWFSTRVVSDGTHFRGYIGRDMVVHGHGTEPKPGRVGLYVEGTGTLLLDGFSVEALR